mmetsp:Transcript_93818/g.262489  ORF Transcript_93818/g.262489 Transcript_93818/m.262489 type:complete len:289 (+) Transcript_93818:78-944(+)
MGNCQSNSAQPAELEVFEVPEAGISLRVRSKRFGWKPDLPDHRDRVLSLPQETTERCPPKCDLRPKECFPIYDQGNLGSCTANAICAAFHFDQIRQNVKDWVPCRLFVYYNERCMENTVDTDSGASLRDGITSCNKLGVCSEKLWPYIEEKFTEKPPSECFQTALKTRATEYARVPQNVNDMKACIAQGWPFVFGFTVCESFMTEEVAKTGKVSMPHWRDKALGGHAVIAVGYDDGTQTFTIRNSWSDAWGDRGYFYLPYAYICHPRLAQDFWVMKTVEGEPLPTKKP